MAESRSKGRRGKRRRRSVLVLGSADRGTEFIVRMQSSEVLVLENRVEIVLPFGAKGRWFVIVEVILVL
jgi:hypothetical protein